MKELIINRETAKKAEMLLLWTQENRDTEEPLKISSLFLPSKPRDDKWLDTKSRALIGRLANLKGEYIHYKYCSPGYLNTAASVIKLCQSVLDLYEEQQKLLKK